jgi:hypothetical protein
MSRLRLEYIEAGSLTENPSNWRTHPAGQTDALKELIGDPDIGWAGACLYNERTKRLIDGHARKNAVDPATPIPVLIGDWSEEAEKKILLTLDPLAGMATVDPGQLRALLDSVEIDSEALKALADGLAETVKRLTPADSDDWSKASGSVPSGEKSPFQTISFTLSDSQAGSVKAAMDKAKKAGDFSASVNENSNGNALARICEDYIGRS